MYVVHVANSLCVYIMCIYIYIEMTYGEKGRESLIAAYVVSMRVMCEFLLAGCAGSIR